MTQTLTLGPLVLSLPLLAGSASYLFANHVGRRVAGTQAAEVERHILRTLLVGLVAARLAFVVQFHDAYLKAPLSMLDIRDGGAAPCEHVRDLLDARLAEIEQQIAQLTALRDTIAELRHDAAQPDPDSCSADQVCRYL